MKTLGPWIYICFSGLLSISTLTWGASSGELSSPELKVRFQALTEVLRCPKCQNQSLSDSDSIIAIDLREQVIKMLNEGRSDDEIRDFMVYRYGDFILYDPPFKAQTLVLWMSPFVLLLAGGWLVWRLRPRQATSAELSSEEQARLAMILGEPNKRDHVNKGANKT